MNNIIKKREVDTNYPDKWIWTNYLNTYINKMLPYKWITKWKIS